ncbi:type I restriction-modification system subunit M N-terminal domain-containing protein [Nitrosomonas ureae]|uniref:site-specific DNA-methyltransferase (adenine-specific) n=1 Tax=Nitrosomonas ureae TaxID=44577 RepID=A0A2T5I5B1_9PROT|nr:type I restriction-modification system subunit M N-terminal domain-containing protein [Nitrosomonas ureae]PTQ79013.1 HsdM-like protein [Nitrosomonas ureae]
MTEEQRRQLQQQLWNIANTLRGKMNADEFRDYILGFFFYKYLSEKVERYADSLLAEDQLKFAELKEQTDEDACQGAIQNTWKCPRSFRFHLIPALLSQISC